MSECLFCKMATGEIQPTIVFEDANFLAFHDINPKTPVHVLVIPKTHVSYLSDLTDSQLAGQLLLTVVNVAKQLGLADDGYRTVINCKDNGGQTVYHLHVHILGGRFMTWPPG